MNNKLILSVTSTTFYLIILWITFVSCKKSSTETPAVSTAKADLTKLPFGGTGSTKIIIRNQGGSAPDFTSLWLCGLPANGAGANNARDWTNADGTWDYTKKPQVGGNVIWNGQFNSIVDANGNRILTGNGLPNHPTGIFPITPGTIAYNYDRNPNIITAQPLNVTYPSLPKEAASPTCVGFGPAGYSLTGSAIYHGASTLGNDAAAHEMLDKYGGHTDGTQRYHYHFPSKDLQDHIHVRTSGHSALMGYMLDGFGIYGPYGENGELLSSKDLDVCHGHKHPVMWDGQMINLYHYHWTYDFPYNISAYKGTPR
ncbi:YHYH protein [Lacihabitans sp. CS3-21]|uniref:YHYH protein n=1 Tax=Lacihabitans sp. CS3-21 TaxID=2487332 RepID=UPI0020CFBABE|nr:YHYH protein [Lacihabitans sp. CS3-21]MCP9746641.1 YHYH protein [Lacihabitans sp. CS3-21]